MGEVYRARDARLDRDVAIKVLPDRLASNEEMRGRFEREARAIAALSHPNILAIHELAVIDGRALAVMELLEGESLRARVAKGPMAWREVAQIGARIADGLAAAHAKGIVHRDLKPENVMLTGDLRPKILDFGLARSSDSQPALAASAETVAVTEPGRVMGTVGYMAPEQVRGDQAGPPADLFALGCTMTEMLTGTRPFARRTPAESLAAVLHDAAPDLIQTVPDLPTPLAEVIAHCLEKNPADRFQSAHDVAAALRAVLVDSSAHVVAGRRRTPQTRAIAVLPFTHPSSDPNTEYLSEGLTESVINALSQLPRLRVVPRSTVFRYKDRDLDVRSIGLALHVQSLITGRVTQQQDMLHIQVELIDVATESQTWGERFRFALADLVTAQEQIAWQISEALRMRLTGAERKKLRRKPTADSEAYAEYLRGRHQWSQWTAEGFRKAIEHFEAAIAKDPGYARAYAGLGDTYGAMGYYSYLPPTLALPRAEAAAQKALEIDPSLAEAHTTMGQGQFFYYRDWAAAESWFTRAETLDPRYAPAYTFHALLHVALGHSEEALAAARKGRDLDPLSPVMQVALAWCNYFTRHFDETIELARDLLLMQPDFAEASAVLAVTYERVGAYEQAAQMFRSGRCFGLPAEAGDALAAAQRAGGPRAYWLTRLAILEQVAAREYLAPYPFVVARAQVGDLDGAFAALHQVIEERGSFGVFIAAEPAMDPLRADPRFDAALRRLNLPAGTLA